MQQVDRQTDEQTDILTGIPTTNRQTAQRTKGQGYFDSVIDASPEFIYYTVNNITLKVRCQLLAKMNVPSARA